MYVDQRNRVAVLAAPFDCPREDSKEYTLFQFAVDRGLENRLSLSAEVTGEAGYSVLDFATHDEVFYLLDSFYERGSNHSHLVVLRLRKFDLRDGATTWVWQTPPTLATGRSREDTDQLAVAPKGIPYLLSESGHVIEIDMATGQTARSFSLRSNTRDPYFGSDGLLYAAQKACDLQTRICWDFSGGNGDAFLGVDDEGSGYTCDPGPSPLIQRKDGTYQVYRLGGIVVDSQRGIFIGSWDSRSRKLVIRHWNVEGNEIGHFVLTVPLEDEEAARNFGFSARLIQVDESGFYVTDDITLYHYSPDEELKTQQSFLGEAADVTEYNRREILFPIESSTVTYPLCAFEVDAQGRLYFPITDPEGVKVVRFNPFAEPEKWEE
jgi:hypothetical protein